MLPHLAAAYNLARWLTRNGADAEDLVQDAYLRALKAFDGFRVITARVAAEDCQEYVLYVAAGKPCAGTRDDVR